MLPGVVGLESARLVTAVVLPVAVVVAVGVVAAVGLLPLAVGAE